MLEAKQLLVPSLYGINSLAAGVLVGANWRRIPHVSSRLERFLPLISVLSLAAGIGLASLSRGFTMMVRELMEFVIGSYGFFAPLAIYVILTPALIRLLSAGEGKGGTRFAGQVIGLFAVLRIVACIWGCVFTAAAFGMPLTGGSSLAASDSFIQSMKSIGWMVTHSTFFFALYASIITVLLASRLRRLRTILEKCSDGIESLGEYFVPVVPFFMLAVGAYLFDLPSIIATHEISGTISTGLKQVTIFGYAISTGNAVGIVTVYVAGALLTGIACTVWHCVLMAIVKIRMRGNFSISGYLKNFWAKVYPLLWATSSESLAVPLMLHLMKVHYPKVREHIRRFVIGGGSFLNINGTLICVFVMAGVCTAILGYKLSFIQLMCALPIVFLIGYGVPGIPGELILFAGPMLTLLNMPDGLREMFLVLYLGLQIGLPDSFRTGSNSTDNCLMAVYIDRIYEDKFEKAAPQEIAEEKAA